MSPEIESNEIQSVLDMLKYNDVKPNWQEEILKSDFITGEKGSRKIAFRSKDPALINYSAYEGKDSKGPYISYYDI